ncbi:MAG TPA: carboxypeptidase-like regulatory domain-containing protein [Candidatus Nanoarchaeia archaeon]|nr:carboxypeptidase-like regulatory domain-containing protein [Candidatus Nanoarchaeia archaeon]
MAVDLTSWTVSSVLDFLDIAMALVMILIIYYLLRLLLTLFKSFKFPSFGGGDGGSRGYPGGSYERSDGNSERGSRERSSSSDEGKGSRDTPKEEPKLARVYGSIVNQGGAKLISKVTLKKDGKVVIEANFNGAYQFINLVPGDYDVTSRPAENKYATKQEVFKLAGDELKRHDFIHEESQEPKIFGIVTDHDGIPLFSKITLLQGDREIISKETTAEGKYEVKEELKQLPAGTYKLRSEPSDALFDTIEEDTIAWDAIKSIEVNFKHVKTRHIKLSGSIGDEEGNSLGCKSKITLYKNVNNAWELVAQIKVKDYYEFPDLGSDNYKVVSNPLDDKLPIKFKEQEHEVSLFVKDVTQDFRHKREETSLAVLLGKISDTSGNDLGCETEIKVFQINEDGEEIPATTVIIIAENTYEIPRLHMGRYKVSSTPASNAFLPIGVDSDVIITIDSTVKEYDFQHPLRTVIPARIRINAYADKKPIKSSIQLLHDGQPYGDPVETNPDKDPGYEFVGVAVGKYRVISTYQGQVKESEEFNIFPADSKDIIIIHDSEAQVTTLIVKVIRRADGKSIPATLVVEKDGKEQKYDVQGGATFDPIDAGKYKITSIPHDADNPQFAELVEKVTLTAGKVKVIWFIHGDGSSIASSKSGFLFETADFLEVRFLPILRHQLEVQENVDQPGAEAVDLSDVRRMIGEIKRKLDKAIIIAEEAFKRFPPQDEEDHQLIMKPLRKIYTLRQLLDDKKRYGLKGLEGDDYLALKLKEVMKMFEGFSKGLHHPEAFADKVMGIIKGDREGKAISGGLELFPEGITPKQYFEQRKQENAQLRRKPIKIMEYNRIAKYNSLIIQWKAAQEAGDTAKADKFRRKMNDILITVKKLEVKKAERRNDTAAVRRLKAEIKKLEK